MCGAWCGAQVISRAESTEQRPPLLALPRAAAGAKDFLVDCLALRREMRLLEPVLSSPRICKVVHGGGNDVLWLQRDFGLFLVNCFDTEKACQARPLQGVVVGFPSIGACYGAVLRCGWRLEAATLAPPSGPT